MKVYNIKDINLYKARGLTLLIKAQLDTKINGDISKHYLKTAFWKINILITLKVEIEPIVRSLKTIAELKHLRNNKSSESRENQETQFRNC